VTTEDWKLVREHVERSRLGCAEDAIAALGRLEAGVRRAKERLQVQASPGECWARWGAEDYSLDCSTLRPDNPCTPCLVAAVLKELEDA
jgi:hypothetical protein